MRSLFLGLIAFLLCSHMVFPFGRSEERDIPGVSSPYISSVGLGLHTYDLILPLLPSVPRYICFGSYSFYVGILRGTHFSPQQSLK